MAEIGVDQARELPSINQSPDVPGKARCEDRQRELPVCGRPSMGKQSPVSLNNGGGKGSVMATDRGNDLTDEDFAFPKERKEPLTDERHVRNAIARFDQVEGVSDAERDQAWKRIMAAAKRYDIEVSESDWRDLAKGGKGGKHRRR